MMLRKNYQIREVESANVIVTDNNAYVGVVLKEGIDGTEELEDKIADEARTANTDFNNVYVSTNPDFAKQFTEYGEKIRANKPVEGFFESFQIQLKEYSRMLNNGMKTNADPFPNMKR